MTKSGNKISIKKVHRKLPLFIVIVLYNKRIEKVASWKNFLAFAAMYSEVMLLIYDNSKAAIVRENLNVIKEYRGSGRLQYFHNKGKNRGLSYNYNRAIDYAEKNSSCDYWLFLSDHDTSFSLEYLINVYKTMQRTESVMIAGIIDRISPLRRYRIVPRKGDFVRDPGFYRNLYCINSGLCIHSDLLGEAGGRFCPDLFLDMIDFWLMDALIAKEKNKVIVVDGEIRHRLSAYERQDKNALMKRFIQFKKDFKKYCRITGKSWLFREAILIKRYINIQRLLILKKQ